MTDVAPAMNSLRRGVSGVGKSENEGKLDDSEEQTMTFLRPALIVVDRGTWNRRLVNRDWIKELTKRSVYQRSAAGLRTI